MKIYQWFGILCGSFVVATASAQTMVESFEYGSDDELLAAWTPSGNTTLTLTNSVALRSAGKTAMHAQFNFPSTGWATETIRGPSLATMVSIAPTQYVTFRLRGDPAFATSNFDNLYLYVYDADGNYGRWGGPVPTNDQWQVVNYLASSIQQPWDWPTPPDFSRIVQFAFFQYGSGETPIDPYTAGITIDDLMVRDTPLTEFPAPSAPRGLIDDFEDYADDAALLRSYTYENSPTNTVTTASLASPAPQGSKALKLAIDFAPGQWPWGSVRSPIVAPFSLPTNAIVSVRFKGDPALAATADGGTIFWLNFYDKAGGRITFSTPAAAVITSEWTNLEAHFQDFGDTSTVDTGNLVQWRVLVEGWQGTADSTALSGAFFVDDIRITVPSAVRPSLALVRDAGAFKLGIDNLTPGTNYELRQTSDFSLWTTATVINATNTTASWTVPNDQPKAFFQLVPKTSP